ncbi:MAG: hypothetical protein WDN49_03710 [Acetobacteraceae bacterium]
MPPMPGPWPARGSKMMNGRLRGSVFVPAGGQDPHEAVVHRAVEPAAVEHKLELEAEDIRAGLRDVLEVVVRAGAACRENRIERCHASVQ